MSTSVCMSEMRCPALGPLCGGSVSRLEYRDPCTLVNERNANQRLDLKLSTVRASEVASPLQLQLHRQIALRGGLGLGGYRDRRLRGASASSSRRISSTFPELFEE